MAYIRCNSDLDPPEEMDDVCPDCEGPLEKHRGSWICPGCIDWCDYIDANELQ